MHLLKAKPAIVLLLGASLGFSAILSGCGTVTSQSGTATASGSSSSGSSGSTGTASNSDTCSNSGFYFDTVITITLYGTTDTSPIDDCFALAADFEQKFSNTIEDSEVSQINAAAGTGTYVTVSDDTLELIQEGIHYGEISDGAFDITIGSLSSLWNISEIAQSLDGTSEDYEVDASMIPADADIQAALSTVDYHNIEIDGNKVRLNNPDATLDLGGIAKGYIADKMKECLLKDNITSALINLGGNVLAVGSKPDGSDYNVGVQRPFDNTNYILGVLQVSDRSVVTSGVYERYFRVNGKLYHHILDLSTGYPCDNDLYSVTIISDSSMDGDALSTTCFCLGIDKGMELIESMDNIEAIFVDSNLEVYSTSGINSEIPFTLKN